MRERGSRELMAPTENRAAAVIAALSLLGGIVVLLALSGTAAAIAASVLFGLTGIALVSLVFLIVGQSEEADRRRHPRG
jgi:hypothetical protein